MDEKQKTALAVVSGTVLAGIYFWTSESTVPREANCSYLAPASTDLMAWGCGAVLIYLGHKHGSPVVVFLGAAIATLHLAQFAAHKAANRPGWAEIGQRELDKRNPIAGAAFERLMIAA